MIGGRVWYEEHPLRDGAMSPRGIESFSDYFAMGGTRPSFDSNCTALWRGYVGSWEIVGGR